MAFWVGVVAFAVIVGLAIKVYWPVSFAWDFNGYRLVNDFVDAEKDGEVMMRDLAIWAEDDYTKNRTTLATLYRLQSGAFLAFGLEVLALAVHLAVD